MQRLLTYFIKNYHYLIDNIIKNINLLMCIYIIFLSIIFWLNIVHKPEDMCEKSITDLPTEVIEKNLLVYLSYKDVDSFSSTGDNRFKHISNRVLKNRGKFK